MFSYFRKLWRTEGALKYWEDYGLYPRKALDRMDPSDARKLLKGYRAMCDLGYSDEDIRIIVILSYIPTLKSPAREMVEEIGHQWMTEGRLREEIADAFIRECEKSPADWLNDSLRDMAAQQRGHKTW